MTPVLPELAPVAWVTAPKHLQSRALVVVLVVLVVLVQHDHHQRGRAFGALAHLAM